MTLRGAIAGVFLVTALSGSAGANEDLNCGSDGVRAVACDELANRRARQGKTQTPTDNKDGGKEPGEEVQPPLPDATVRPFAGFAVTAATLARLQSQTDVIKTCHADILELLAPIDAAFTANCECKGTKEIKADASHADKLKLRLENLNTLVACLETATGLTHELAGSLAGGGPPPPLPSPPKSEDPPKQKLNIISAWAGDPHIPGLRCSPKTVTNWVRSKCLYDPVKPGAGINSSNALALRDDVIACQVENVQIDSVCGGENPNPQGDQMIGVAFRCKADGLQHTASIVSGGTLTLVCP
ncbi:hypothetical protein SAMN05428979_1872 [Stappia sp. ES.058]|nr:hypothetical protein SAMN05428979_1872 [Stappia sp. ES.058]